MSRSHRVALAAAFAAALAAVAGSEPSPPFERTEQREPCAQHDSLRRPLFGDLHVHTSYSFDSYTSGQRNDPWGAYRYAMGESIALPGAEDGEILAATLARPLDFAAVTDHAETLGEIDLCTGAVWSLASFTPLCIATSTKSFYPALVAAGWWSELISQEGATKQTIWQCELWGSDCANRRIGLWEQIRQAAEDAYDRTSECRFTSFVGYEYTDTPNFDNLHRNVIFRNDRVVAAPISSFDTGSENFPELWRRLRVECIEAGTGCDVIAIPHNSNLAGGRMFRDPRTALEASERLFFEPVVELVQHKGASECRFDRQLGRGVGTADELCTFEQNKTDSLQSLAILFGEVQSEGGAPTPLDEFAPRNLVRNVLKDGLALERRTGTNPFKMGFIGSTDTHSATPGAADEEPYLGHLGRRDAGYRNVQDHVQDGPGGLAVVWAEENSRDSIFSALRRKETYATSGTRIALRFFAAAGDAYDASMCEGDGAGAVQRAYERGVPMGGELAIDSANAGAARPRFFVSALADPGTASQPGTDLQRVQIVKGWIDGAGAVRERVIDVAGDAANGAGVDPATCAPMGQGAASLCAVWEDTDYAAGERAFYYARVLENPTCRWSTRQCIAAGVNPFAPDCRAQAAARTADAQARGARGDVYGACCWSEADQPFHERTIQERAWSSPIWVGSASAAASPR